jgi:hypothetical protein
VRFAVIPVVSQHGDGKELVGRMGRVRVVLPPELGWGDLNRNL